MKKYPLSELALLTKSELCGDPDYEIGGIEHLDAAGPCDAAFCDHPRYEKKINTTKAGVVCIAPHIKRMEGKNYLIHPNPSLIFQRILELFLVEENSGFLGVHPTAVIHETAQIGRDVQIGPHTVIDRNVHIADRTIIGPNCYIGPKTTIGSDCHLYAHVTIHEGCIVKNHVIIQSGVVIGSIGFGYHTDAKGEHHLLKHLGNVILEDGVEIGANTAIDRARFTSTIIGKGTKIDNLVQIAHNVELGPSNLIVSQVGIAGSTKTGSNVVMGGQAGIIGHVTITNQVMIAARAAVSKAIEKPGIYSGAPALPVQEFNRLHVQMKNIGKLTEKVKQLEEIVGQLKEKLNND